MKKIIFIIILLNFLFNIFLWNLFKEIGYELGHYIKTGEKIEAKYVYFFIVKWELWIKQN